MPPKKEEEVVDEPVEDTNDAGLKYLINRYTVILSDLLVSEKARWGQVGKIS